MAKTAHLPARQAPSDKRAGWRRWRSAAGPDLSTFHATASPNAAIRFWAALTTRGSESLSTTFFSSSTFSSPSTAVILTLGSECAILGKKKSLNFISSPPFMPDQAQTAGPVICGYATISVRRCSAFCRTSGSESSWAIRLISSVLCISSMARMQLQLSFPPGGLNAPATPLKRNSSRPEAAPPIRRSESKHRAVAPEEKATP